MTCSLKPGLTEPGLSRVTGHSAEYLISQCHIIFIAVRVNTDLIMLHY